MGLDPVPIGRRVVIIVVLRQVASPISAPGAIEYNLVLATPRSQFNILLRLPHWSMPRLGTWMARGR
jgi:hypothetical protein